MSPGDFDGGLLESSASGVRFGTGSGCEMPFSIGAASACSFWSRSTLLTLFRLLIRIVESRE